MVLLPSTILLAWWLGHEQEEALSTIIFWFTHNSNEQKRKANSSRVAATIHSWGQHLFF